MSIIKGLRAAAARSPTVSNAVTVTGLMSSGGLAVGELTETTARKLSAVDGCMEILSNSISKLPNFVMDGRTREHVDHYLLRLLNVRPNEAMTPSIRRKVLENSRFQPTRPLRGATASAAGHDAADDISIHAPLAGRDSKSVQITMHIFAITDKFQMLLHRMPPVRAFCSFLMQENHADFGCEPPK